MVTYRAVRMDRYVLTLDAATAETAAGHTTMTLENPFACPCLHSFLLLLPNSGSEGHFATAYQSLWPSTHLSAIYRNPEKITVLANADLTLLKYKALRYFRNYFEDTCIHDIYDGTTTIRHSSLLHLLSGKQERGKRNNLSFFSSLQTCL